MLPIVVRCDARTERDARVFWKLAYAIAFAILSLVPTSLVIAWRAAHE